MPDLLPPSSTELERRLAAVLADATAGHFDLRRLWNPETCPLELLPWLAWAWSVDHWDPSWTEQQKRDTVASALQVQSIKGTAGAVQRALDALGINARVQEWWQQTPPEDPPYTFRVFINAEQVEVTADDQWRVMRVIDAVKNARSHLASSYLSLRSDASAFVGCATHVGAEITVTGFQPSPLCISDINIVLGD